MGVLEAAVSKADMASSDGQTPLHLAARGGHVEAVAVLIAAGTAVDAADICARTPLHSAAETPEASPRVDRVVAALAEAGAAVNVADHAGHTPLDLAASLGRHGVVKVLLSAGAVADASCTRSLLHAAATSGDTELAMLLTRAGAVAGAAGWGNHATMIAALNGGHMGVVAVLLAAGVRAQTCAPRRRTVPMMATSSPEAWAADQDRHRHVEALLAAACGQTLWP